MPNNEYFQSNPTRLDVSRSRMTMHPRWTGSWNTGKLVPIFATSGIMPGDTVRMDISAAIRSITPVFPVMDDCDITVEAFFVPHRLTLSRKSMSPDVNDSNHSWAAFLGAQDSLLNMPTPGDVQLPSMNVSAIGTLGDGGLNGYRVGGLADCLGFAPTKSTSNTQYKVNCLKPLAYYSIWNDYFREPNTMAPVVYTIASGTCQLVGSDAGIETGTYKSGNAGYLPLAPVCRYHGYFGSALPWPQRNTQQVEMPLGEFAPVVALDDSHLGLNDDAEGLNLGRVDLSTGKIVGAVSSDTKLALSGGNPVLRGMTADSGDNAISAGYVYTPRNLWADLSTATAATINQLRMKVQEQRWYEALARGGNKLEDLNYSMFGVRGPSVATRPEYLGGVRIPISISQVASTSDSGTASVAGMTGKVGGTGAFSLTNMNNYLFTKSFTEHGTLMVVACVRVHDSFGQGISREDTKFDRFSFYWPQFANLGEMAIRKKEVYVDGQPINSTDEEVFGYQESWAEYRMFPDQVTGHVRPGQDLAVITYANNFAAAPTLKSFLDASSQIDNVDRTLQVTSAAAGFQWYGQFQFNMVMTRPMPLYSIPGLIDHH